jgi:hypothetical protein
VIDRALPGSELVEKGLEDLRARRETVEALLVSLATTRLRGLGFSVPNILSDRPEERLYHLLALRDGDAAHASYNALVRRLVSFENACARGLNLTASPLPDLPGEPGTD